MYMSLYLINILERKLRIPCKSLTNKEISIIINYDNSKLNTDKIKIKTK
jgi:hypothetical protein